MVPGLDVAQISGNTWSISSRGFNGAFANKMLVIMDGRTVYSPVFSGVFWDAQDTLLADVERIEVIRGPGAALWGTNAVNGVINIITKTARRRRARRSRLRVAEMLTVVTAPVSTVANCPASAILRVYAKGFSTNSVPANSGSGAAGWMESSAWRIPRRLDFEFARFANGGR